jgi:monoamine oxidase
MRRYWSRRGFLRTSALALAGACAHSSPAGRPSNEIARAQPQRRSILVVGAGLAGLSAAYWLRERGYTVQLLEARPRPGGRILTVREPFRDGQFVEAGATFVVADPELLGLFKVLGVALEKRPRTRGLAQVRYVRGVRSVLPADAEPPPIHELSAEERALGEQDRMGKYLALAKSFDPRGPLPAAVQELDAITGAEFLRRHGASSGFIAQVDGMIGMGDQGVEGMSAAALVQIWASILEEIELGPAMKVMGGTGKLPDALAAQLAGQVVYGACVRRIEQDARAVQVHFERRGERAVLTAERVVVAIPSIVLRAVEIAPALSSEKARAARELGWESVTRIWLGMDERFWASRGEAGSVESDVPLGGIREETDGLPGRGGVLGMYVMRGASRQLAGLSDEERLREAVAHAEKLQPGAERHFVGGASVAWDNDPFARGAYAWFKPGQLTGFRSHLARAEGRLHFAGDHTSHRPGFMHGAVASARRVVDEITAQDA